MKLKITAALCVRKCELLVHSSSFGFLLLLIIFFLVIRSLNIHAKSGQLDRSKSCSVRYDTALRFGIAVLMSLLARNVNQTE